MQWGTGGWLLMAGIIGLSGFGVRPSAHAAARFAARNFERAPDASAELASG
jgi:hypothetical protein